MDQKDKKEPSFLDYFDEIEDPRNPGRNVTIQELQFIP